MTRPRRPRTAAVLAAALNSWATATRDDTDPDPALHLQLRQAPDWEHVGKVPLSTTQADRLLYLLREDLVPPRRHTPVQAAQAVDQLLAEWKAEGRTVVRPHDLVEQLPRIAQTRAWLAQHLVDLVDTGYLAETRRPGTYRLT